MSAEREARLATLFSFGSDRELAESAANHWLDEIAMAQRDHKPHRVALSGGRITLKLFAAVIESAKARRVSLGNVEFFWADERCVPPTDPECNFAAADKFLFLPLGLAPERIHRIRGEDPPELATREAEAEIRRFAPPNANGLPVLDLIFLGMGEDGHVASLFPGETETGLAAQAVYRVVTNSPKPPPNRVTLTYAAIAAARQVWVLASGAAKESALRASLQADGATPLAQVLRSRQRTRIFTDVRLS